METNGGAGDTSGGDNVNSPGTDDMAVVPETHIDDTELDINKHIGLDEIDTANTNRL